MKFNLRRIKYNLGQVKLILRKIKIHIYPAAAEPPRHPPAAGEGGA